MAGSEDRAGRDELLLLKRILSSSSQCSLGDDPKPKQTTGDGSSESSSSTRKTDDDTDDTLLKSSGSSQAERQGMTRPKTSLGGRTLQSRRRNGSVKLNRCTSADVTGSDAANQRRRMYNGRTNGERTQSTGDRKTCKSLPSKNCRRPVPTLKADHVAKHTNSLETKYQELRDLLEDQFLKERQELNSALLKETRQAMHQYRLTQSGYVPANNSTGRRRRRVTRENDTQSTQTDELAKSRTSQRNVDEDIWLGETNDHGDSFILIDATKGPTVTKHVTFMGTEGSRAYNTLPDNDDHQRATLNAKRPGRLRRGREKTRTNSASRRGQQSVKDSSQQRRHSDDDSDTSSGSTVKAHCRLSDFSISPTTTASTSPSRESSNVVPMCDHHLKYSSNAKLIEWLRHKNRVHRQNKAEERKAARKKRCEEETKVREKELKNVEADRAVALWLKKKRSDAKLLRKRQRADDAFNLQQQLNGTIEREVTLGTTVYLTPRDSRDGSSSARGKLYASSLSSINTKVDATNHVRKVKNKSSNNNSLVGDTKAITLTVPAGNDRKTCMCGFTCDTNFSQLTEPMMGSEAEHTRHDSTNKIPPSHDHQCKPTNCPMKARLGSTGKRSNYKRRSVTTKEKLHKVIDKDNEDVKLKEDAEDDDTDVTTTASPDHSQTGRKTSASRVGKLRKRRLRKTNRLANEKLKTEDAVININTGEGDDSAEQSQCDASVAVSSVTDAAGENDGETPQSNELKPAPRRPCSARPGTSKRGRRLPFETPSPPKPSASPTVGQSKPGRRTSGRASVKIRTQGESPTPSAKQQSAPLVACQKNPTSPKPLTPHTRSAYNDVLRQQKSWDAFSENVWKQVNEDGSSDHGSEERPEPQGSDKPDDDQPDDHQSTALRPIDVASVDRETTSSVPAPADADTDDKNIDGSEKLNENGNGEKEHDDIPTQANVVSGDEHDSRGSTPATTTGDETSDSDRTSSDDSINVNIEIKPDCDASTVQGASRENETETTDDTCVNHNTEATRTSTKSDSRDDDIEENRRDKVGNSVTFLTNTEHA